MDIEHPLNINLNRLFSTNDEDIPRSLLSVYVDSALPLLEEQALECRLSFV